MSVEMIIYALVGLALLFLIIKLLKWPIKILINGIIGIVLLYVANYIGEYFNFYITINPITALIAGFLGIPGVIFLVIFQFYNLKAWMLVKEIGNLHLYEDSLNLYRRELEDFLNCRKRKASAYYILFKMIKIVTKLKNKLGCKHYIRLHPLYINDTLI